MSVSLIGSVTTNLATGTSSSAVTTPSGAASGDCLIGFQAEDADFTSGGSLPSGFTEVAEVQVSNRPGMRVGYLQLASSPAGSYTFAVDSNTNARQSLACVRGQQSGNPFQATPSYQTAAMGGTTSHQLTGMTADNGSMVFAHFAEDNNNTSGQYDNSITSGWTIRHRSTTATFSNWIQDLIATWDTLTGGATGNVTATSSDSVGRGRSGIVFAIAADVVVVENEVDYALDAVLLAEFSRQFSLDSVLMAEFNRIYNLDAVLRAQFTRQFTLDAILAESVSPKQYMLDALLKGTFTVSFNLDAIIANLQLRSYSLDAILSLRTDLTYSLDALLERSSKYRLDALLKAPPDVDFVFGRMIA